jgi:NAD-dependent dihydropyrimidine dehydrogenase PreA subunit
MPGLFIDIQLDSEVAKDAAIAKKLEEVCPVSIFRAGDTGTTIVEENLDECTLCDLCLEAAPKGSVRIVKLYES